MFLSRGSAALQLVITNNEVTIIKTCPAGLLGKGLWIVPQRHSGVGGVAVPDGIREKRV